MTDAPSQPPSGVAGRPPLIRIAALVKHVGAGEPLRVDGLTAAPQDRLAVSGLDAASAEVLVHLVTGASLPDAGEVSIDGRPTTEIATDTEWLASLDRFGLVSERAVLFGGMPTAMSLALPLSLALDPMPDDVRAQVEALAEAVGLPTASLEVPAAELSALDRLRVHLARAVAHRPAMLLLERPTAVLQSPDDRREFGGRLRRLADARGFGWIALSDDGLFVRASGARQLTLDRTGRLSPARGAWRRWLGVR